jgi:hypothetical protein
MATATDEQAVSDNPKPKSKSQLRNEQRHAERIKKEMAGPAAKFFMVSGQQGPPRKRYGSALEAGRDAAALANKNQGQRFHILAAIGYYEREGEQEIKATMAKKYSI